MVASVLVYPASELPGGERKPVDANALKLCQLVEEVADECATANNGSPSNYVCTPPEDVDGNRSDLGQIAITYPGRKRERGGVKCQLSRHMSNQSKTGEPPPKPTKELPLEAKPEAEGGSLAERQRSRGGGAFSGAC